MVCTKIFPGLVRGLVILIINVVFEKNDNEVVVAAVWHSPALLIASAFAHQSDDVEAKIVEENEAVPADLEASPKQATHTFARSKDGVSDALEVVEEHDEKENAEVPSPRNNAAGMQSSPTATACYCMHTGSAVPTHRETENNEENDEADEEASVAV